MVLELAKTDDGKERPDKATDRLDARTAEFRQPDVAGQPKEPTPEWKTLEIDTEKKARQAAEDVKASRRSLAILRIAAKPNLRHRQRHPG